MFCYYSNFDGVDSVLILSDGVDGVLLFSDGVDSVLILSDGVDNVHCSDTIRWSGQCSDII